MNNYDIQIITAISFLSLILVLPISHFNTFAVGAVPLTNEQLKEHVKDNPMILDSSQNQIYNIQFKIDKSQFKKAPEFTDITGYLNTNNSNLRLIDLRGKVVLVHFWTYNCSNCIHTIPHLNEWYQKYSNKGFTIVGVQTPEFEFEKNIEDVKAAIKQYDIKYPVIQDNNYATWNAYGNKYWPSDYLIDTQGFIRYNHIGEGGYDQTEKEIKSLLVESGI